MNDSHSLNFNNNNGEPEDNYWQKEVMGGGERLDIYLKHTDLKLSRTKIQKKIRSGEILVNRETTKPSYRVKKGDLIQAVYSPPEPSVIEPEKIQLDIIYEDRHIIVLNKQKDTVVHPAKGHSHGTLVNGLLYHCKNLSNGFGNDRPGVIHRLDRDTTGVIIFAKSSKVHGKIALQFQERKVKKTYLALVWGTPPMKKGEINAPIGRSPVDRKLMAVTPLNSRDSLTTFKVIYSSGFSSLLKLGLETGRTHQIRVHLSHYGYPVVGDPDYGGRDIEILKRIGRKHKNNFNKLLSLIDRQALHAAMLKIYHPVKERDMKFTADLHDDMKRLLEFLYKIDSNSSP